MKKLSVLIALTVLAACSPKKSEVRSSVTTSNPVLGGLGTQCTVTGTAGSTAAAVGTIYDNSMNSFSFEQNVKGLLSATINPYEVGSISPQGNAQTGVRFSGTVKLDSSGNVLGAQSAVTITVYDSIWQMNQTASNLIKIEFTAAKGATISGQFNTQSGQGNLVLQDQYGTITFNGTLNAQNFSGTVSYQNAVSVLGSTPASGSLGQFFVQKCAFLQ